MKQTAIILSGSGPFELTVTQNGAAAGNSQRTVAMTLFTTLDEHTEETKRVSTQMTPGVARDPAIRLWLAADESESK
jgi:hypothetical protein